MPTGANLEGTNQAPRLMELLEELPPALLAHALRHASWVEARLESYERLEFLGDSVLGLAVASYLYTHFPDFEEGRLAKLKAYVVSRASCTVVAQRLGVDALIRSRAPGSEEQKVEMARSGTALGNVLEALIGAVFVTHGFDIAESAVMDAFREQVTFGLKRYVDFKSALQEYLAAHESIASYHLAGTEGPPHDRVFTSQVLVDGEARGTGVGTSIKTSEQEAAREALIELGVLSEQDVGARPPIGEGRP